MPTLPDQPAAHPLPPSDAMPSPLGRAKSRKGDARVAAILEAALHLLGEEGYASITLERVARSVGMRKGNLQYYFPTKADLLRAVLSYQIAGLKVRWRAVAGRPAPDARTRLFALVDHEIALGRDEMLKAQAWEKWAFAAHDAEARRIVNGWYRWISARYAELIAELRPDLDPERCTRLAAVLYALLEGATPFLGRRRAKGRGLKGLDAELREAVARLIAADAGAGAGAPKRR